MKLTMYVFAIFLMINLFSSCTPDDSVEVGLNNESQREIEPGGEYETPIDNEKNG